MVSRAALRKQLREGMVSRAALRKQLRERIVYSLIHIALPFTETDYRDGTHPGGCLAPFEGILDILLLVPPRSKLFKGLPASTCSVLLTIRRNDGSIFRCAGFQNHGIRKHKVSRDCIGVGGHGRVPEDSVT